MHDLRSYLEKVARTVPDQIIKVEEPVDYEYAVTERVEEAAKSYCNPAILFHRVKGSSMPLLINLFGHLDRVKLALEGAEQPINSRLEFYSAWNGLVAKRILPVQVKDGPVKEVRQRGGDVDLASLPVLKFYEQDGGRYITSGLVTARDPDRPDVVNLSYARMQVKGRNRLATSLHSRGNMWSYYERSKALGRPLDIAITIGAHPAIYLAAAAKITDEYLVAGSLLGEPVELVRCETVDIPVPASAEIILEGRITLDEEDEGPFTEYTGYLSGRSTRNLVEVNCITRRRDAIYHTIMPSNSDEHLLLSGLPKQARIYGAIKGFSPMPAVRDIYWPPSGTHYICLLSLDRSVSGVPGLAKHLALLAFGLDPYLKLVAVFPDDVEVSDLGAVLGAIAGRCDMVEGAGVQFISGVLSHRLDPSSVIEGVSSKMLVDATSRLKDFVAPEPILPHRLKGCGVVDAYYPFCDSRLMILKAKPGSLVRAILKDSLGFASLVICVDEDVDIRDLRQVVWAVSTRFQPVEDVVFSDGRMGVDGTRPPGWKARLATIPRAGSGPEASRLG
jgi:2,5-furandicarboxylate decarboxylase 1